MHNEVSLYLQKGNLLERLTGWGPAKSRMTDHEWKVQESSRL